MLPLSSPWNTHSFLREKSCHTVTFPRFYTGAIPVLPDKASSAHFTLYTTEIQLWLLSQAHQSHVLKGFSVSAVSGMSIIHTEVLARLLALVPSYPELMGQLCQQCLSCCRVCPYPVLIPLCGFFQVGLYTKNPHQNPQR